MGVVVLVVVLVLVTGGKQSQLLVRLTWTGMDLDWSLTIKHIVKANDFIKCNSHFSNFVSPVK